ncbi:hypothetical protein ACQ4PT_071605 [Festuca glaucescens]
MGPQPAEHPNHSSHTTTTWQTHAAPRLNRGAFSLPLTVSSGFCLSFRSVGEISQFAEVMRSPKQPAKLDMLLLLALLLLCNGVGYVHGRTIHENSVDLHALLDFKKGITSDPQGALNNWTTNTHFCRWNGVNCTTTRPFRILSLNLTAQNLQGQISSSLGNLTFIESLDLSHNNFVGPLPILGHLQKLQILYLNSNHLNGTIPDSLGNCSSLAYLDFSVNSLVGAIPPKLGSLSNLFYLDLSVNLLQGAIPQKLGSLSNLGYISLKSNQLEGSIPRDLGRLSKLQVLILGQNRLSGEIPHDFFNLLAILKYLSLESNMLGKALPPNIGDNLPNLIQLALDGNSFEGPLPSSLGNASLLQLLDLSNNSFTGQIPTSFGKLSNLTTLNLELNNLEARDDKGWEFINALRNCRSLTSLSLSYNQLQGSIPHSIGHLSTSLQQLLLAGNSLSGQIP